MDSARKRAEEALAKWDGCRVCQTWKPVRAHALSLATALRAFLAETAPAPSEALPLSEEDECPCCLTHSCPPFRRYVERTLRPAPAPSEAVREAAEALRHKMREVYADSRYMNVWATAQGRLGPYSGPDWIAEAAALDAALAARGGE